MSRFWLLSRILSIVVVTATLVPLPGAAGQVAEFRTSRIEIETASGRRDLKVEVAETEEQRAQGLQWRRHLAPDSGMLFDFQEVRYAVMWMKNTFVPLDMVFIARDGLIVNIVEGAVPQSLAHIFSDKPVRAVLELNAGSAERLGIKANDRVIHPIFGNKRKE